MFYGLGMDRNNLDVKIKSQLGVNLPTEDFQTSLYNTSRSLTELMAGVSVQSVGITALPSHPGGVAAYIMGASPTGNLSDVGNHLAIFLPRLGQWAFIPPVVASQVRLAPPRNQVITWNNTTSRWEGGDSTKLIGSSSSFANPYSVAIPSNRFALFRQDNFLFRAIPFSGTGLDFNVGLDTNLTGDDDTAPFVAEKALTYLRLEGLTFGDTPAGGGGVLQSSGYVTLPNSLFLTPGTAYAVGDIIRLRILTSTAANTTPSLFSTGLINTNTGSQTLGTVVYSGLYPQVGRIAFIGTGTRTIDLDFGPGITTS